MRRAETRIPIFRIAVLIGLAIQFLLGRSYVHAQAQLQPHDDVTPVISSRQSSSGVNLISTTAQSIVIEFIIPAAEIAKGTDSIGQCDRFYVSGYSYTDEPRLPRLPTSGTFVGIPSMSREPSLVILNLESEILEGKYRVCPVQSPFISHIFSDSAIPQYEEHSHPTESTGHRVAGWYPPQVAEIVTTGFVRDQRLSQIRINPIQYDSHSGEVRYIRRLLLEVLFDVPAARPFFLQPESSSRSLQDAGSFEGLLQSALLNYDTARQWRNGGIAVQTVAPQPRLPQSTSNSERKYRIVVQDDGLYELAFELLQDADPAIDIAGVDPAKIRMYSRDQEIAILLDEGLEPGLDPGDRILFYGQPVVSKYTQDNIYWLTWGDTNGLRMNSVNGSPSADTPLSNCFTKTLHLEENLLYRPSLPSGDGDRWYWNAVNSSYPSRTYGITLTNVASTPLSVTVRGLLKGYGADPYHSATIYFNGQEILTTTWQSGETLQFSAEAPSSYLVEGPNTIRVDCDAGVIYDVYLVDWFEVDYPRTYKSESNQLQFTGASTGTWQYEIGGLTVNNPEILDITTPEAPVRIAGYESIESSGVYTVTFEQGTASQHQYFLSSTDELSEPLAIERYQPSADLLSHDNAADYVIITHRDFYTAVQPLASHHSGQGLRVLVADVQDVYDQFNAGIVDPTAIKAFLSYAYANWQFPPPSYVLLVGDGNYDPLDYLGWGEESCIPPYLADIDPWMGETAADNQYVTIVGNDNWPDMHLGRLPVKTTGEAEALVAKILDYSQAPLSEDWNSDILFVADNVDEAGDFLALSDMIADGHVPAYYDSDKVYYGVTHTTISSARHAITTTLNAGALIVNYVGHGSSGQWASEGLLKRPYVAELYNDGKLPFMVPMTCLEGYYIAPSSDTLNYSALAEEIVRLPTHGAIASWSATGLGLATGHDYLNRALFDAIFKEDIIELGPATTYAKLYLAANSGGSYLDLLDTYLLFGDPATRLNVLPVDLQIDQQIINPQPVMHPGQRIDYTLTFTNTGPATAHHVVVSDTWTLPLLNPVSASSGVTVTQQAGTQLAWDVSDLAAGTVGVITVTGSLPRDYTGVLTGTASIDTTTRETETLKNLSTMTVTLEPWPFSTYLPLVLKASP